MTVEQALALLTGGIILSFIYLCYRFRQLLQVGTLAPPQKKAMEETMSALFIFCLMLGFLIGVVPYWLGMGPRNDLDTAGSRFSLVVSGEEEREGIE